MFKAFLGFHTQTYKHACILHMAYMHKNMYVCIKGHRNLFYFKFLLNSNFFFLLILATAAADFSNKSYFPKWCSSSCKGVACGSNNNNYCCYFTLFLNGILAKTGSSQSSQQAVVPYKATTVSKAAKTLKTVPPTVLASFLWVFAKQAKGKM